MHIPVKGGYVVSSLAKDVILLSYAQIRKDGFRLVDKPGDGDNIFLLSPTHPVDGKKYRILKARARTAWHSHSRERRGR